MTGSGVTQTLESLIGPPSELISVADFLASGCSQAGVDAARSTWKGISLEERTLAEADCSVTDIRESLESVWDNPALATYLVEKHDLSVNTLLSASVKAKRSQKKAAPVEAGTLSEDVLQLQDILDGVPLRALRTEPAASLFVRPPRNHDWNTLKNPTPSNEQAFLEGRGEEKVAILTLSIYNKVPWGPSYVTRICQQAYLSTQALADVYNFLPCAFKVENPVEADGGILHEVKKGCALGIEGVIYGTNACCVEQVVSHLGGASTTMAPGRTASLSPLDRVTLGSLSIRLHQPYTLLHSGNCEHFIVFEQIRLRHDTDPLVGYPQLLQVTPPLPALCRACKKVPATWSIAGDMRLGESPCLLCRPCWESMGIPSGVERAKVTVVALPFLPIVS